jgi:hypothetical protein
MDYRLHKINNKFYGIDAGLYADYPLLFIGKVKKLGKRRN